MPSKEHEALVEKVAKAINGPFRPVPAGSPYTLDQLRDIRWQQINEMERKLCLAGAEAAFSTIRAALQELNANQEQIGFREAFDSFQMLDGEPFLQTDVAQRVFSAVLAASALGEQSE
ncbi:hypothetical protein [Brucella intermedia]|uniref:hypothetical protein n=1 Tax=Brucella intermedia TaxID=94625 RepID=UPI001AEEC498|nr:hypothetical protein [Brucella intermedia]